MSSTDVIFNIGAVGTETAAGNIKGVITALDGLRKSIMEAVNSAQAYQQVVSRLEIDMSKFNATTEGQIDTLESYKVSNELTEAGIKATAKEMEALGKAAISHNKAIGGGPGGATRELKKLASGLIRARESALLPYGIELSQTTDKTKAHREILDKAVKKYSEYEVVLETTAERMYSLENTIGTINDQLAVAMWDRFSAGASQTGDEVWELVRALETFSTDMKETNGRLADWIVTNEGLTHSFNVLINTVGATLTRFDKFNDNLKVLDKTYGDIVLKMKIVAGMTKQLDFSKLAEGLDLELLGTTKDLGPIETPKTGGKKKKVPVDLEFSIEEMETGIPQEILDVFQGYGKTTGEEMARSMEDSFFSSMDETFQNMTLDDIQVIDPAAAEQNARMGMEIGMAQERAARLAEIEAQITEDQEAQAAMRIDAAVRTAGATSGILGNLQKSMDKNSESGFKAAKGMAMAQVAVDTPAAAMAAYKSVVGIPYVGPVLAVIAAGAAVTAGLAQMAQIKKQKFNKSGSGSSVSSASVSAPSISSTPNAYGAGQAGGGGTTVVNKVLVDGQVIHTSMINANNDAEQRNSEHFAVAG